ncbi:MAG: ABC transporter permease [Phycisphaerales bacterium]|nr:MAG: ABC transporter permease [Phycisphaerales bacterium]
MSFLLEIIRLGLHNLRLHKLRSFLTSLGIILGVAAVIVMISIGEGTKQAALRDIQALGATNVIVRSIKPPETVQSGSEERSRIISYGVTNQDLRRLRQFTGDAASIVPLKAVGSEISYRAKRTVSQTFGTTPALMDAANLRLEPRGRYLSDEDLHAGRNVAVIGSQIARQFFSLVDPLGSEFRIDQRVFRVIGVLKPVGLAGGAGSALVGRDLNKDIHIPLTTATLEFGDLIVRQQSGSFSAEQVQISEVYLTAASTDEVVNTADRVKQIVAVAHPDGGDVEIIVPWELLENVKKTQLVWDIVLISIAAISLLVGGIGIMNIMLASVTERTREIGIRRALGATRNHIIAQFLVETGSLSAVGGVLGIGFGVCISVGIDRLLPRLLEMPFLRSFIQTEVSLETQITGWSIVASFFVAAAVGLIFGVYPAIVASRQDPIVALRHD